MELNVNYLAAPETPGETRRENLAALYGGTIEAIHDHRYSCYVALKNAVLALEGAVEKELGPLGIFSEVRGLDADKLLGVIREQLYESVAEVTARVEAEWEGRR